MENNFYGYLRVSTIDQNDERQRVAFEKYGIIRKNIYGDKLSGKDFNRPQYQKLRKKLKTGDVLVLKSLDRLGRNYKEIQEEWRFLVKVKSIDIVILDMPILDTRTNKDLIGTLISDIVLQLLSYVAQAERENIKIRQAEGIAVAKARGVQFGRPTKPFPENFDTVYNAYITKKVTRYEAAQRLDISQNTFKNFVSRRSKNGK